MFIFRHEVLTMTSVMGNSTQSRIWGSRYNDTLQFAQVSINHVQRRNRDIHRALTGHFGQMRVVCAVMVLGERCSHCLGNYRNGSAITNVDGTRSRLSHFISTQKYLRDRIQHLLQLLFFSCRIVFINDIRYLHSTVYTFCDSSYHGFWIICAS